MQRLILKEFMDAKFILPSAMNLIWAVKALKLLRDVESSFTKQQEFVSVWIKHLSYNSILKSYFEN